jgi:hypothetical protein
MRDRKPVSYLPNICLCMCFGNLTVQLYTPPFFGCFQWIEIIEDLMFSSLSSDFSCSRMNVDSRLLNPLQCYMHILMWVKFLIEVLTIHAINITCGLQLVECVALVEHGLVVLCFWLVTLCSCFKSMPHNNLEFWFQMWLIKMFLHCCGFCDISVAPFT